MKAVLFDLDDTLFDHSGSSTTALGLLRKHHPNLERESLETLAARYLELIEASHLKVLHGTIGLDDARIERFKALLGGDVPRAEIAAIAQAFRGYYQVSRREVPGAKSLLTGLRKTGARILIVSNNFMEEQRGKLRHCGMDHLVDALVVSEEVGATKPHPKMFEAALRAAECRIDEAIMVGDKWEADIEGAAQFGLRTIWLNRTSAPCPKPGITTEVKSLDEVLAIICGS